DPEPGAWTTFRGQPLKVRRVVPVEGEASLVGQEVRPGTIVEVVRDGPLVGTGEGRVIRLADVQPAGKKWMSGAQFAAGYRPTVGEKLE
ncbi:MAG: methionyl-tRNA formyltransferase, partial [Armatimonadetes bacterium]|nr:methionyl-tRNA formyltransferase [Armatimonadota bacterium]